MYCSDLGESSCKRALGVCREYKEGVSCPLSTGPARRTLLDLQPRTLKSVNTHRGGGCPGHDPRDCPHF